LSYESRTSIGQRYTMSHLFARRYWIIKW